jgi:hypothetical protein
MNTTNLKQRNVTLTRKLKSRLLLRRRRHDPWLVLSLLSFNSGDGWNRTFNPLQSRENIWVEK